MRFAVQVMNKRNPLAGGSRFKMFTRSAAGQKIVAALLLTLMLVAVSACGPGLKERKTESETHYKLGVVYLNDRNFIMALEELTEALRIYPDEPSYYNAIGLAYFAKEMNAEAKRNMLRAVELKPDFSEAYVNLAAVYLVERDWESSIEASRNALKNIFYKTPELAHFNIAQANFNMHKYQRAVEGFRTVMKLNPRYVPALYNLGLTYEKLSETAKAISAYERAISISPNYSIAYFKLGMLLAKTKQKGRAIEVFNRLIKLTPGSAEARSAAEYIELLK